MSGNANARESAEALMNELGSKGLFDFGALLKGPVSWVAERRASCETKCRFLTR